MQENKQKSSILFSFFIGIVSWLALLPLGQSNWLDVWLGYWWSKIDGQKKR